MNMNIRVDDHFDFEEQFGDLCVIDVDSFYATDNDGNTRLYRVGEFWHYRRIIAAFIHPESECAWFIADGYFEVSFNNYTIGGVD